MQAMFICYMDCKFVIKYNDHKINHDISGFDDGLRFISDIYFRLTV